MDPKRRLSDKQFCFLCAAAALMVLTAAAFFLFGKKHVAFCDESLSYESANSVWKESVYERVNEWLSGEEIEAYYAATDINPHLITITKKLWVDHVPFYFWLLRFASLIAYGSASPLIGLSLNLFCALLFFIWLFALVGKKLKYDRRVSAGILLFSLLFFFSSPLFFSQLTLIRMYLLVTLLEFVFLWYAGSFFLEGEGEKKRKFHTGYILAGAFGLLTHYLFLPFYGITAFLIFCLILIKARKKLWPFIRLNLVTLLLSCALDPWWIYRLFRYNLLPRGQGGEERSFDLLKILYRTIRTPVTEGFCGRLPFVPALLLVVLIFAAFYAVNVKMAFGGKDKEGASGSSRGKAVLLCYTLFVAADLLYFLAVNLMSDGTGRYVWPPVALWDLLLYGALIQLFIVLLIKGKGARRLMAAIPALLCGLVLCFNLLSSTEPGGIDSLYADSVEPVLEEKYSQIPWVVCRKEHSWCEEGAAYKFMIPERIAFLSLEEEADGSFTLPEEFFLVSADWNMEEAMDYLGQLDKDASLRIKETLKWEYMEGRLIHLSGPSVEE